MMMLNVDKDLKTHWTFPFTSLKWVLAWANYREIKYILHCHLPPIWLQSQISIKLGKPFGFSICSVLLLFPLQLMSMHPESWKCRPCVYLAIPLKASLWGFYTVEWDIWGSVKWRCGALRMIAISLLTSSLAGADLWQVAHWQACVGTSSHNKKAAPWYRKLSSSLSWWNLPKKNTVLKPEAHLRFQFCAVARCHILMLASQIIHFLWNFISQAVCWWAPCISNLWYLGWNQSSHADFLWHVRMCVKATKEKRSCT